MDPYTPQRLMLDAHSARIRAAEERSRLLGETLRRESLRWWMAGCLRTLADRLDGRAAPTHLRVVH